MHIFSRYVVYLLSDDFADDFDPAFNRAIFEFAMNTLSLYLYYNAI